VTPAAITKAQSLLRYVQHTGCPQSDFTLAVTLVEAYELLDYVLELHAGNLLLRDDVLEARAKGDPFAVLANFNLLGFDITRAQDLN
jgi:hypothetical protein